MPIQIQCSSVVIRNDSLDRVLENGAQGFAEIAPNAMSFSDECLSQASFMSSVDAEEFAKALELRGLVRNSPDPDFVIVSAHDQSIEPPCDWLILFEFEQRLVATMRGNPSTKLIVAASDADYDPNATQHYSREEFESRFEFVERKDSIDTYRDKQTGQLVYHTRTTETPDEIFSRAFAQVWKFHREAGGPVSETAATELSQPITELQSLIAKYPEFANAYLALGMAWFAVGRPDHARRQLERGAELDPTNTFFLKELGAVCLDQNDFPSAAEVATRAVAVKPDDPELLGNLAVCQLMTGSIVKAKQTIEFALRGSPNDTINLNIRSLIDNVAQGRREQPRTFRELLHPRPKKKSILARFFGN